MKRLLRYLRNAWNEGQRETPTPIPGASVPRIFGRPMVQGTDRVWRLELYRGVKVEIRPHDRQAVYWQITPDEWRTVSVAEAARQAEAHIISLAKLVPGDKR